MKFIVDVMLGTLAKWLRIMGFDTIYDTRFTDDDLFFKAHQEQRILLTKDADLAFKMNPRFSYYLSEKKLPDQLRKVINHFQLTAEISIFSRCVRCNEKIKPIKKEIIKDKIPAYVFQTTKEFFYCCYCEKIYWPGSHVEQVKKFLENLDLIENE